MNYDKKEIYINMLDAHADNFFTGFPQKMLKTLKSPIVINACLIVVCFSLLSSCSYFKGGKKQEKAAQDPKAAETSNQADQKEPESLKATPEKKATVPAKEPPKAKLIPDSSVLDMSEAEVKKKFGEPDMVSKMVDNRILWTYQPSWKIMPDNKDTVYIEFVDGKVVKIIRAR
jgi:hypothetical protein